MTFRVGTTATISIPDLCLGDLPRHTDSIGCTGSPNNGDTLNFGIPDNPSNSSNCQVNKSENRQHNKRGNLRLWADFNLPGGKSPFGLRLWFGLGEFFRHHRCRSTLGAVERELVSFRILKTSVTRGTMEKLRHGDSLRSI
ncbi:MAG: hypothetical protein IBX69_02335 [Anaerolineales bacterium]|nr:hypothetical protein [Anaerolineales bacterium]